MGRITRYGGISNEEDSFLELHCIPYRFFDRMGNDGPEIAEWQLRDHSRSLYIPWTVYRLLCKPCRVSICRKQMPALWEDAMDKGEILFLLRQNDR